MSPVLDRCLFEDAEALPVVIPGLWHGFSFLSHETIWIILAGYRSHENLCCFKSNATLQN
jgi:hypothetical protein